MYRDVRPLRGPTLDPDPACPGRLTCRIPRGHALGARTLRRRVRAGKPEQLTDRAAWWRCRRPGASRWPSRWCSQTTSQDGGTCPGGRGLFRRARRAGWGGTRAACHPTDPAHLEVVVPAERAGSGRVTPRSTRISSSRPVTPWSGVPASAHWSGSRGWRPARSARPPGARGVDDHHRRRRLDTAVGLTCCLVQRRRGSRPSAVA